jgi:hypothetical protein
MQELGVQVVEFLTGQDFTETISNATNNVNVTDAKILNTTKVLGSGVSSGATSACSAGIGTSFLRGCYTFDTADISNDTATNSGTLGTLADAEYFSDSIKSPFVINTTGIINQAVLQNGTNDDGTLLQNGTNDDGTPFAPGRTQGEIRLVNSSNISEFNFIHTLTGSNLTSINFWIFGDVDGSPEYPLITSMSQNAGEDSGMNLHTRGADMCLNLGVNGSFVVNNSCVIGGPIPADDGEWHMVTLLMDKGNTTSFAKIYIDGSSIGTINGNAFSTDVEDSFRELKIGGTEFASSRVETTWFVDDFAIWNGYQLTDSDVDTLFNVEGDEALVTVTDANILNTTKVLNDNANITDSVATLLVANITLNDNANVTDSITVGLTTTETINGTLNNVTATDSVLFDVIKGLPAGTAPAIFFNSSVPNVANQTDFFTEVSDNGMMGEDITLDNQRPTKVIIANVSGTSTNGTLTMKVFTNVTLDVSTLGDGVLRATSDSYDLTTFDISTNKTLTFNFTSAPFITGSAFGLEMAGLNGSVNLPIDQSNAGGKCFEVKDLVPIANFSKGPKDTLCEQFSFEVYVSNATSDDVIVTDNVVTSRMATQAVNDTSISTDSHILNTTKVIDDTDTTGGGGGGGTAEGQIGTVSASGTRATERILANTHIADEFSGFTFELINATNGKFGQVIELDSDQVVRVTLHEFGQASPGAFGNVTAVIWSNVTADGATTTEADHVVEATSDVLNLADLPFPVPTNGFQPSWNFTGAPSLTGTHVIGFTWDSLNLTEAFHPNIDMTDGVYDNTASFCGFLNVTSGFWENCGLDSVLFGPGGDGDEDAQMEIVVSDTVADLSVTTTIEPTKLLGYWTFDDAHVDDQIVINAGGTLGSEADGTYLENTFNRTVVNGATAKVGESLLVENQEFAIPIRDREVQIGTFVDRDNWQFLYDNSTVLYSMAFQIQLNETGFPISQSFPIISNQFDDDPARSLFTLKLNNVGGGGNEFQLDISNVDDDFFMDVDFTTLGAIPQDGEFHDVFLTLNKTIALGGGDDYVEATICIDNSTNCETNIDAVASINSNTIDSIPQIPLMFQMSHPVSQWEEATILLDEVAIWKDHLLTATQMDLIAEGGAGTIEGVGTVTASGSSTTEYQLQIGGHAQIPDTSGFFNVITQLGDDDVITGNLINLTSDKISRFTIGDQGGPNGNGTTPGTIQAFIWSNATVGSSKLSDLVVEASSDILAINDYIFPQVPQFRQNFDERNDFYPISFNFTGAPTLTGEYLLGFKFENLTGNLTRMDVGLTEESISPNFLVEELEGVCIGNGTAFTDTLSSSCPTDVALVHAFTFSVAAERTVSDLIVDTPIAPSKLKAYWTFDDNAVDGEIALAAGSLGHEADATMLRMKTLQSATLERNSTGLIGASYNHTMCGGAGGGCIFNGTITRDADYVQGGLFSNDHRKNWVFLHALGDTANKTSTSFWVKFPTDTEAIPSNGIPFISTGPSQGNEVEDDGILYGIGPSDTEFMIQIKSNSTVFADFQFDPLDNGAPGELTFPGSTTSGPPHFDGEWHHIAYIVDKGNSTFPVKICVDGTTETAQSGCRFVAFDTPIDNSTKDPKYTMMIASMWETGGIADDLSNFEMDEIAIWEDYLLTDSEINQIATMAVVTTANVTTAGAGVIVTDSVVTLLEQSLNQTISNATNFVNVTDAHILNTTKVIDDTDTSGGGGSGPTAIGTVSTGGTTVTNQTKYQTHFNSASSGIDVGIDTTATNGRLGQLMPTLSSEKISSFSLLDVSSLGGMFGNLTGKVWSNATIGAFEGDLVTESTGSIINLANVIIPSDNEFELTFNFTSPPTLSGSDILVGFEYDSVNTTSVSIFTPEAIEAQFGAGFTGNGQCVIMNNTFALEACVDRVPNADDFKMEIRKENTADDKSVTTTIEPSKLYVYHTFDTAETDGSAFINAGTLGHTGDATYLSRSLDATPKINSTNHLGQAFIRNIDETGDEATNVADTVQIASEIDRPLWNFMIDPAITPNKYSLSFWASVNPSQLGGDQVPFVTTASDRDNIQDGFWLGVIGEASNELSLKIFTSNVTGQQSVVEYDTTFLFPVDGEFHHVSLIMDLANVTSVGEICLDGTTCETFDRNSDVPDTQGVERPLVLGTYDEFLGGNLDFAELQMDDFGLWRDYLLTDAQIQSIANATGAGTNGTGVIVTDSVNAIISSTNSTIILNGTDNNVNATDTILFNVTKVIDNNANVTDSVTLSADFNQTVGTADNNVNVTDSVIAINSKNQTIPSGTNFANITDSVILNMTKFLVGDQVDMTIANLTIVNATAPPSGDDVPTGGPPTDAPESGVGSGGGGVPTSRVDPALSASLTGLSISEPDHTLSTEIIINPFFSSGIEEGSVVLNWDQQEPVKITSITIPPEFEQFIDFTQEGEFQFAGAKADPTDTFSTGIIEYEVKIPSLALGVTQDTNPFGTAVTFDSFLQLAFFNEYTIPITVDAVHNGKPFSLDTTITVNHIKEVRWVVIAITIAGVAFLAVWGKSFFAGEATTKAGSFRKNLDKAKRATVDKQKSGSFRKELERQRRADRQNIKKLKKK